MKRAARPRLNLRLEGSLDKAVKRAQFRLLFLFCAILITLSAIALKTITLTFFYEPETIKRLSLTKNAIAQSHNENSVQKIQEETFRKSIYDRNGILLSSNLITSSLYANPKIMIDPVEDAKLVSKALPDLDEDDLIRKFSDKTKSFVWIKRNLHPKQKYEVNALGIPGLMFEDEEKRIYPHGRLFSHVIGMVGQDGRGLSGLEKFLDNLGDDSYDQALQENNITTTLDIRVQAILRDEVQKAAEKHKALTASGVVLDANSGEILAMVSLPDYDPNLPKNLKEQTLFDTVTQGSYELGSVFKPFTFSTAFDTGKINEKMVFDASTPIKIGKYTIKDFHPKNRPLTTPEILMYSSNIGTAKIAIETGTQNLQEYFRKLGFFSKLDVEVVEKFTPSPAKRWGEVNLITASYGHGIAVSPLHVAAAMAAVVNGGLYYQPTLIKRTRDQELTQPSRVFSKRTSDRMRDLLRLVVVAGSGKKADIDGYLVGGKTGTAEKVEPNGKYSKDKVISSFAGIFPMNDPKYIIMIVLDDPKPSPDSFGLNTAGWVAAPAVGRVIARIAPILKVRAQEDNPSALKAKFGIDSAEE